MRALLSTGESETPGVSSAFFGFRVAMMERWARVTMPVAVFEAEMLSTSPTRAIELP